MDYYGDNDPFAAEWLRQLIRDGLLPEGAVDERSIKTVESHDLARFRRVHLFGGIGGWPLALELAGWPDARPVWTGSCPCQPYSSAGKGEGRGDPRDLWPEMLYLVRECRPPTVIGEQVEGAVKHGWLDRVFADLEREGYACAAAVLPAACVGAPHIRHRIFWVADAKAERLGSRRRPEPGDARTVEPGGLFAPGRMAVADLPVIRRVAPAGQLAADERDAGLDRRVGDADTPRQPAPERGPGTGPRRRKEGRAVAEPSGAPDSRLGDAGSRRLTCGPEQYCNAAQDSSDGDSRGAHAGRPGGHGFWSDYALIPCTDGKARRVEPGVHPLAPGVPRQLGPLCAVLERMGVDPKTAKRAVRNAGSRLAKAGRSRIGRLRGYGNAIVPEVAAEFVRAFLEARLKS